MELDARSRAQDAFQAGEVEVVVATVAFGMGIDKRPTSATSCTATCRARWRRTTSTAR